MMKVLQNEFCSCSLSLGSDPDVHDKSSVAPGMEILSYCQREWKGNTAKSAIIRKVGFYISLCEPFCF